MNYLMGAILEIAAGTLAGCAGQSLRCSDPKYDCDEIFGDCHPAPPGCRRLQPGASVASVVIDSSPTTAEIYVDGELIGRTPLEYPLSFTSETRYVVVVAKPLYPSQTRQERRLRVPPPPDRIQFFMTNAQQKE